MDKTLRGGVGAIGSRMASPTITEPLGDRLLSVKAIAKYLGISPKSARALVRTQMRWIRWGKEYRVAESEVLRWRGEQASPTSSQPAASASLYKGSDPSFWDK